jgi:hypothetical protein
MPAFIWNTNHLMWKVVAPFSDSADVLKSYIVDPSAYVYWSTPRLQDDIKAGDAAYIFRTVDREGIVACGIVEEAPRQLTSGAMTQFAFAARLTPPGWDEQVAPSAWKTGIRITRTFWDDPIRTGFRPAQGAIGRLGEADIAGIAREIAAR